MMTHRIKILPFSTFRLNVTVCKPYNADFDGDEMNMHIPQSYQTAIELEQICIVPKHIISPGTCTPCIEIVQDTLLGAYLLTVRDAKLKRDQMNNYMAFSKKFNGVLPEPVVTEGNVSYWNGKQLYSLLLPDININQLKNIKIVNGIITSGFLDSKALGSDAAGLIKQIYNAYGMEKCNDFLNDTQKLITRWMSDNSFTIGFGDCTVNREQRLNIKEIINKYLEESFDLIRKAQHGVFANDLDDAYKGYNLESELMKIFSNLTEKVKDYLFEVLSKENNFYQAGDKASGSKGKDLNIQQIIGCVGQQDIWGSRIEDGYTQRTLPHFPRNDFGPDAKGFCRNSFIEGLSPSEMFFHAMGGRTGTIDTAIKSVTGDTPIIIMERGETKHVLIGNWIDGLLDINKKKVQNLPEKEMELLELDYEAHIPTTDLNGNVSWGIIKNITRHDPGKELYEIKTHGGRNVIVTESHSLLIWNGKEFERRCTGNVSVGDFVPVTAQLAVPPVINYSIDISKYLSKSEYLYGSEYNKAYNIATEILKTRKSMPANWWNENNGKTFILPYKTIQSFTRTIKNGHVENIKNGYIYSFKKRNYSSIKENFELNEDNGLFLGLYIAEGNSDIPSGYVQITNLDDTILDFCKKWFENNNIEYKFDYKLNKIGGRSKCIRGYSTVLATILYNFVGHGARNKFISPDFFNAPESFIKKLMNGIFSGDGTVTKTSIQLTSASHRLITDINVCLSRIGIFGKVTITKMKSNNLGTVDIADINLLSIRSNWAKKFKDNIDFISYEKNEKLKIMSPSGSHINFSVVNDTVLDAIVEINKVDIAKYPKVYDLTIPSTLNFGLANGLHVVDTADSGYLSRKFIKASEDLTVHYDFTVRNASRHILQFSYGDDNFDPTKLERVTRIELIEYDNAKIESVYKFDSYEKGYFETFMTKDAIDEMLNDPDYKKVLEKEFDVLFGMREELRYNYYAKVEAIGDVNTYIPINLFRVIPSQLMKFNVQPFDLANMTPQYIIKKYDETMEEIVRFLPEKSENWKLFKVIFKSFLSPKRVLYENRMTKDVFDSIIFIIKDKMLNALINPGEMVGVIGAQTLGESSTQLTLNSVTYETEICVRDKNKKIRTMQIGDFINREIKCSEKIDYMEDKDTTYAECKDYFEIQSCDEDGKVTWERIEAVTKHPVINLDGTNTMLKVTTEEEHEVTATKAKSFLKLMDGKILPVNGSELKVGDYLPVSTKEIDFNETFELNLKEILPCNEYVYGSELEKAKAVMSEHHWWKNHANKTFVLPHRRSDTVVQLASDRVRKGKKTKNTVKDGMVYMMNTSCNPQNIPEVIPLNYNWGYLIGAYAAEGCMTNFQLSIANNVDSFFEPILELCRSMDITTKIYRKENKNQEGWTSQDLRIYSTLLCRLLEKFCGKLSHNKFILDKIVFSNKECLRGVIDGYIGGDGSVTKDNISIGSVSKRLLEDFALIIKAFGVFSHLHKCTTRETNNRGSINLKQGYVLNIYGNNCKKLAKILNVKINHKMENAQKILRHNHMYEYGKRFQMMPNEIDGEIVMEERDDRFIDTVFTKIKSIEEVPNTTKYAYDLTVEKTRTFNISNSLCVLDTFHQAGVGTGSLVVTQAIPRLREIINVSKNLKNKNMAIYLKEHYAMNKENAKKIQSQFGYTQLKDILQKTELIYDNKDGLTDIQEDIEFIKSYKEFCALFDSDNIDENCLSQLMLRLTFDKESMMNRKITIQEVQETITQNFHNDQEIECIYSDDSVNNVVMRIRIRDDSKSGSLLEFMKDFEKQLIGLPLRGISNIREIEISESNIIKYSEDGMFSATKEWVLRTNGSNMLDILAHNAVDHTRTITNDIIEFNDMFGIEATRELIYRELFKVYSGKPNPRHVQLMADIMTYRGKLMQIDRHGLNKNPEIGPIAKASFEEVMNIFTKAALFAEKDNMKGVSANILAGQFCKSGTNCFDILMDEDKLLEQIDMPQFMNLDVNELMEGTVDVDKIFNETYDYKEVNEDVNDDDFNFGFGMENKEQFVLDSKIKAEKLVLSDNEEEENNTIFTKIVVEEPPEYRNDTPQEYRNDIPANDNSADYRNDTSQEYRNDIPTNDNSADYRNDTPQEYRNDTPAEESNELKGDIDFDAVEVNEIPDYGEQKEEQKEEVDEVIQEPSPKKKVVRKKKEPVSVAETNETTNVATEEVPTVSKKIVRKKKV
jgi:DNA-directed RNA polymerase beta' subunit